MLKIREKIIKFFLVYMLFSKNIDSLIQKDNILSKFSYEGERLYLAKNHKNIISLLFRCFYIYYNTYKTPLLFKNANLEIEYQYLVDYYNEVFDYKDLNYYERQYKNVFNFCKVCYSIITIEANFLIKEFSSQWKKFNFIDSYDLNMYNKALYSLKSSIS